MHALFVPLSMSLPCCCLVNFVLSTLSCPSCCSASMSSVWLTLVMELLCCAAVHSIATQLTIADLGDGQTAQGVMMLQDQYCLWSSLSQQDTASLYRLAATTLVHASQGPSIGKRLASATSKIR
jgi:hypothetical protein